MNAAGTPGAASNEAAGAGSTPVPRYGTADVAMLVPDAVRALTGHAPAVLPLPEGLRGVVVLVVDGLGRRLLDRHADVAPFLSSAPGTTLDAPFPTTTATSLASIGTGVHPGLHGLTGYSVAIAGDDRPLLLLTWSWERHDVTFDARDEVVPERFQPRPTVFDRATAVGVQPVTVLREDLATSGLSRAVLRGAQRRIASGLPATLETAVAAAGGATRGAGPRVVYAHHGDLDTTGHVHGPSSDPWLAELARTDALLQRATMDLPDGVALVVTADHGMVEVPDERLVELADRPELLAGVRVLTGDFRARQLHAVPGATAQLLATWREAFGTDAHVHSRDEAIDAGWFGPSVEGFVRDRIGDVVISARALDIGWVHRDVDLMGGRIPGMHGALTREEMEVPALVLTR